MSTTTHDAPAVPVSSIVCRFEAVRRATEELCAPLTPEDMVVQAEPIASPAKWHLAHTTWFFETFVLERFEEEFEPFDDDFRILFNSYYNGIGEQHPRPERGMLTRPPLERVLEYRRDVERRVGALLESGAPAELTKIVELGLQHEQQHQELILMDVKLLFSKNPLAPPYLRRTERAATRSVVPRALRWVRFDAELVNAGFAGDGFAYDNELPRHRRFVEAFELADRLVTNAEYAEFVADGGYRRPELWLDEGFAAARSNGWNAPLYWREFEGGWFEFTLSGAAPLVPDAPVCHLSFYEAEAFARWAGGRLPTEFEWERAARSVELQGNFVESGRLHPQAAPEGSGLRQMFGDLWEWTRSAYEPYPGYAAPEGAIGEYNGKFMINQQVLRGGACVTPSNHVRPTYRNFFHPDERWQFGGLRLARSSS